MGKESLTKKEIIQIAKNFLEEKSGKQTSGLRLYYDNKNKVWNKYYAGYYPKLKGHNYQAVKFEQTGTLTQGGGPYWVCVDKETGEVLVNVKESM
jgi:hypothetical protein